MSNIFPKEENGMPEILSLADLQRTGVLWMINRTVFHPRGYALAFIINDETGEITGWNVFGDGKEPWNFPDGTENDYLASFNALLEAVIA